MGQQVTAAHPQQRSSQPSSSSCDVRGGDSMLQETEEKVEKRRARFGTSESQTIGTVAAPASHCSKRKGCKGWKPAPWLKNPNEHQQEWLDYSLFPMLGSTTVDAPPRGSTEGPVERLRPRTFPRPSAERLRPWGEAVGSEDCCPGGARRCPCCASRTKIVRASKASS